MYYYYYSMFLKRTYTHTHTTLWQRCWNQASLYMLDLGMEGNFLPVKNDRFVKEVITMEHGAVTLFLPFRV